MMHLDGRYRLLFTKVVVLIAVAIVATAFSPCTGHNLDTRATSITFANDYLALMATRAGASQPLVQAGDEFWVILKTTPGPGTNTGVGGYQTFYIPAGVTVIDAAFVYPDPSDPRGYANIPAKGQSAIAIGDGPIGAKTTPALIGLTLPGTNGLGFVTNPVTGTGLHRGTLAGVYADTGIFYSTDPRTVFNSYNAPTNPPMTNNSGDTVGEWDAANVLDPNVLGVMTLWDSYQLRAYGRKDVAPIIDSVDGRGNAPWGLANAVAGPQSGYAWEFDYQVYQSSGSIQSAISIGPWQRIQYPGSQISSDTPGLISTILGQVGIDASLVGISAGALPPGVNAIRFALGQLELGRPEYSAVKVRIDVPPAAGACYKMYSDAFGGDAGGTDNGKDHIWRYFDPTVVKLEPCVFLQKVASKPLVAPGEVFSYTITFANNGSMAIPNVTITDTLPSGLTHVSANPAPTTSASPNFTWNIGTVAPGGMVTITQYVKATGTGTLINTATARSDTTVIGVAQESVEVGYRSVLTKTKSVTPSSVAPGSNVQYTLTINNVGTGSTGTPIVVKEDLPTGFSYVSLVSPTLLNGAAITSPTITVNPADPEKPIFTVSQAIQPGKSLVIVINVSIGQDVPAGTYCNYFSVDYEGKNIPGIPEACVTVAGGQIGDTIYRDWNGNGAQDPGEEGMSGVVVKLYAADGITELASTTTDAYGNYLFAGLTPGTYVVKVDSGVPAGYTLTDDPDVTMDGQHTVLLSQDQQYLTADFGYDPGGIGSIGDKVFEDSNKDGVFNGSDVGINGVTVRLYEDTDGDGVLDVDDVQVATALTAGGGNYLFTGLDPNRSYIVAADDGAGSAVDTYFANPYESTTPTANLSVSPADFVAAGNNYTMADFGYFGLLPAAVGDEVFYDANGDGVFNTGDMPLGQVTVWLYLDSNADGIADPGELVQTTVTDVTGKYLFDELPPGSYIVVVDQDDPDLPGSLASSQEQWDVLLIPGTTILTADFPFRQLMTKSVDKTYATSGQNLTFSLKPGYPGGELLENVRVIDPLPTGTSFVSANAGGVYTASYTWIPGVPGLDPGPPILTTAITVDTNFVNTPGIVNVTLNVTSSVPVINVSPSDLVVEGGGYTILSPPPAVAPVVGPGGWNFAWQVRLDNSGEYTFYADASDAAATTSWPTAQSDSVLSAPNGGPDVVTWNLGSNAPGVPGETIISGRTPGIYGFRGSNTKEFSKYAIVQNAWTPRAQPTNGIEKGGSLTTDGNGLFYALEGNSKVFYRYDVNGNTWTLPGVLANTSDNANEGGGIQFLKVGGVDYVYALLGNSNRFRRYDIGANSWSNMANVPVNVKKGGALTTDGTYLYALQGDTKKGFYRYDPAGNTWSALASLPVNVGWGGALTYVSPYIYALTGNGTKGFYRYNIGTNIWTPMAPTPGNVSDGGALTNDGTHIYAFQGRTKAFWRYDIPTNTWSALASANFAGNVGQGGALVYDPGDAPVGYFSKMTAVPSLSSSGDQITVTLELYSSSLVTNVVPASPTITSTGGASAVLVSGPSPASQNVPALTPTVFTWVYDVFPGGTPGSLTFSGNATGDGPTVFPVAQSKSALVSPLLAFVASVDPGAPPVILNTGILAETSGTIPSAESNTTETATNGSIGDRVWNDANGNGVQDPGEVGIAGVTVYIDANGNGMLDPGELYDVTAADGSYHIYGLGAGTYTVRTDPSSYPTDYIPTTLQSTTVNLLAGEQYTLADFGLRNLPPGTGSIGDYIWIDSDSDGVQDPTESGLGGVTVNLEVFSNGFWLPLATTATDIDGYYEFPDLSAGQYRVVVDPNSMVMGPYGGTSTLGDGTSPTYDRDGTATPNVAVVNLPTNSTVVSTADFGYNWDGSIGNYVWWDDNTNGIPDPGEDPIPGAYVLLYVDTNGDGELDQLDGDYQIGLAITDANGLYTFSHLPPGDYLVDVYEDSIGTEGERVVVPTTDNVVDVSLLGGQSFLDADFGYYEGAKVEGNAFWDVNSNGILDPGEPLLQNITVTLTGTDMDGNPVNLTTTTDANGHFQFVVPEGDYSVSYNQAELLGLYPDLGEQTTPDSYDFHAYPGEDWHPSFDFGVDNTGAIGDTVFGDIDSNGSQGPGEPGLAGVTVNLFLDADGNGTADTLLATQITDPAGFYQFSGLADTTGPEQYMVEVVPSTLPTGYQTVPTADPDAVKDGWHSLSLTNGQTINIVDFGYPPVVGQTLYSISGTVYDDDGSGGGTAGDGSQNGTEPGLPNVDVTVELDLDGNGTYDVAYVVQTDANGDYSLAGIPAGSDVRITVDPTTLPTTAYVQTGDPDGTPLSNIYLIPDLNASMTDLDFGYLQEFGSISGAVVSGADGNGLADPGETPVPGVSVTLTYSGPDGILGTGDDTTTSVLTIGDGSYSFGNLLPGLYEVTKTNPPGYYSQADADGGNPDSIWVYLNVDEDRTHADFEILQPAPSIDLQKTGTYVDTTADGFINAGDQITYTFTVTNTGNVPLMNVMVSDPVVTVVGGPIVILLAGASDSTTFTATYTLLPADITAGTFTNTATVNATFGVAPVTDTDDDTQMLANPAIALEKTGAYEDTNGDGIANAGDTIRYTFTVTNTGNVTLTSIAVTDPVVTVSGGPIPSLAAGASDSTTFTATYVLTAGDIDAGTFTNTATVTGYYGNTPVDDTDDDTQTFVAAPGIALEKTGAYEDTNGDDTINAGDTIRYTFTVTNTGNVTLTNVMVTDPVVTVSGGPIPSLAAGASDSTTFTATYVLTSDDVDAGTFTNTATVTGYHDNTPVEDTDDDTRSLRVTTLSGGAFLDLDGDGVLDPEDTPLANATFVLTDLDGNPVNDINGNPVAPQVGSTFSFTNLPAGEYLITEINPMGYYSTNALPGVGGTKVTNDVIRVDATDGNSFPNQNFLDAQGEQPILQAYRGNSSGTNLGFAGYAGTTGDQTTSVPGILEIVPQDDEEPRWANFIHGYVEGRYTNSSQLKRVTLTKQTPTLLQCADVFPAKAVTQTGSQSIRTWWPLMFEVPGTTWTLRIMWGSTTPPYVNNETWAWKMDATIESLKDTLQLFHELPFGRTEVPLISDENLYPLLQAKLDAILDAIGEGNLTLAGDILGDFEMEVSDAWLAVAPAYPNPTGPGTGIVQTAENPAVCKLLADAGYVGEKYSIFVPSKSRK